MMLDANHVTITVRRVVERTDTNPTLTMPAHSLTVSPEGHLSINGQFQSRSFSPGTWEAFEVKRIAVRRR
jgi:hypothetical protein